MPFSEEPSHAAGGMHADGHVVGGMVLLCVIGRSYFSDGCWRRTKAKDETSSESSPSTPTISTGAWATLGAILSASSNLVPSIWLLFVNSRNGYIDKGP